MVLSFGNMMIGWMVMKCIVIVLFCCVGVCVVVGLMVKFVFFVGLVVVVMISFGVMKLVGNVYVDDCYKMVVVFFLVD